MVPSGIEPTFVFTFRKSSPDVLSVDTVSPDHETPYAFQTWFLEAMLGELGKLSCLEARHGAFSTFRRRILRGGYIAWRILRSGTLKAPLDGPSTRVPRER